MDKEIKEKRNAETESAGRDRNKFWLGITVGIGLAALIKRGINIKIKNTVNSNFRSERTDNEDLEKKSNKNASFFWVFLTLIILLISFISLYIIFFAPQKYSSEVTLSLDTRSQGDYMGLQPPDSAPLNIFNSTKDAQPNEFRNFLNGIPTSKLEMPPSFICNPNKPSRSWFEEGGQIVCHVKVNENLSSLSASIDKIHPEIKETFWFSASPIYEFSIRPLDRTDWSDAYFGRIGNEVFILNIPNSGLNALQMRVQWYTQYCHRMTSLNGTIKDECIIGNSTAIRYSSYDLDVISKDEAVSIRQKEREMGYQFIIALFALTGIPGAVYYFKKLQDN
jgi:hypothetical protein